MFICELPVNEPELDRLKLALKVLSDAEKQLRHSSERSTWFTAALLQLGVDHGLENMQSGNNSKKSNKASDGVVSDMVHNAIMSNNRSHSLSILKNQFTFSIRPQNI